MAVAGVSGRAAAQVSQDARGSRARAGESIQGGGAPWAPPLLSTSLHVTEGRWAKLRLGEALNGGPLTPQGMSTGLRHMSPYSPGHPLNHSSLQACKLVVPSPRSD